MKEFVQARQGKECHRYDCLETENLHGITWKCLNGHINTLRYCGEHIDGMMRLALHKPGMLPNGSYIGVSLCNECECPMRVVMEAMER